MRMRIAFVLLIIASPAYAQTVGSTSGASSIVNISSPANTTTHLITAPTVAAPGLAAAGIETCLGSSAGGLSLMGGGFTFGSTKVDQGCSIRLLARQLFAFGFQKAALALMCQDQRVAAAMDATGTPCPDAPAGVRQRGQGFMPSLSFAEEEQTTPFTQEAPVKPFTLEEQRMFARASNVN